jgi:hypothetical protein
VAKPVRIRQLAAADLEDVSEYYRRERVSRPRSISSTSSSAALPLSDR